MQITRMKMSPIKNRHHDLITLCQVCNRKIVQYWVYKYVYMPYGYNSIGKICGSKKCFEYMKLKEC